MSYKLPVTKEFSKDIDDQIGSLIIFDDNFKIPINYVFSLAGIIKPEGMKKVYNKKTKKWETHITDFEPTEISLVSDKNYKALLNSDQYREFTPLPQKKKK